MNSAQWKKYRVSYSHLWRLADWLSGKSEEAGLLSVVKNRLQRRLESKAQSRICSISGISEHPSSVKLYSECLQVVEITFFSTTP